MNKITFTFLMGLSSVAISMDGSASGEALKRNAATVYTDGDAPGESDNAADESLVNLLNNARIADPQGDRSDVGATAGSLSLSPIDGSESADGEDSVRSLSPITGDERYVAPSPLSPAPESPRGVDPDRDNDGDAANATRRQDYDGDAAAR